MHPKWKLAIATLFFSFVSANVLADGCDKVIRPEKLTAKNFVNGFVKCRFPGATVGPSLLITFRTGSAELTADAIKQLDVVGPTFNNELKSAKLSIEGHADPRGSADLNKTLSEQRAESVVSYLVNKHGVDPSRLSAVGKGSSELLNKENPIAEENRRVRFVMN